MQSCLKVVLSLLNRKCVSYTIFDFYRKDFRYQSRLNFGCQSKRHCQIQILRLVSLVETLQ